MDNDNEQNLHSIARTLADDNKIVPMADFITMATRYDYIPDPYYEGAEGFELVLDLPKTPAPTWPRLCRDS